MKTIHLRELEKITSRHLASRLDLDISDSQRIVTTLLRLGIVKPILKRSTGSCKYYEKLDPDLPYYDEYEVNFVGVLSVNSIIIYCYPKFFSCPPNYDEYRLILLSIKKYGSYNIEAILSSFNYSSEYDEFSTIMSLVEDYLDNGIYGKIVNSSSYDGENVNWDSTIEMVEPIIVNDTPFYIEPVYHQTLTDCSSMISRIHGSIICECLEILNNSGLNKLFDYRIDPPDVQRIDLNELTRLNSIIQNEKRDTFSNHSISVLETMEAYISRRNTRSIGSRVFFYGTKNYNLVWEEACRHSVTDHRNIPIKFLNLDIKDFPQCEKSIMELLDRLTWDIRSDNGFYTIVSDNYQIPDIIHVTSENQMGTIAILDAKYYSVSIKDDKIFNNPGIQDVTKQQIYHMNVTSIFSNYDLKIVNIFLFPSESKDYDYLGFTRLPLLCSVGNKSEVQLLLLPWKDVVAGYVNNSVIGLSNVLKKFQLI